MAEERDHAGPLRLYTCTAEQSIKIKTIPRKFGSSVSGPSPCQRVGLGFDGSVLRTLFVQLPQQWLQGPTRPLDETGIRAPR